MYPKNHNFLLNTATKSAFILAKQHLALDSYLCFIQAMCLKPLNQQKKMLFSCYHSKLFKYLCQKLFR